MKKKIEVYEGEVSHADDLFQPNERGYYIDGDSIDNLLELFYMSKVRITIEVIE